MSWSEDQWDGFCALLEEAWPGEFDAPARRSWRVLLDSTPPESGVTALRRLLLQGSTFRPSVSELLAAARHDPSKPTFAEAYQLIYGRGGVMRAQPPSKGITTTAEKRQAEDARLGEIHPLVRAFVERQGLARLATIPLSDPEWGEKHRRDLELAWTRHVEAFDGREVAALASGGRGELARLDPLASLTPPPQPQLTS